MIPLERRNALAAVMLATLLAWAGIAGYGHAMGLVPFLGGWSLMMAAMMLPSIAPLVLLYRGHRTVLAAGYLTVWTSLGLVPWAAMEWAVQPEPAIVLAIAGIYELTPLKRACLRHCRNPATFLMEHYRSGPFRLGVEHGLWCAGCCAGLMVVLVVAASMSLVWVAVIAAVVFMQKVLPAGEASARVTGVGLLVAALAAAL